MLFEGEFHCSSLNGLVAAGGPEGAAEQKVGEAVLTTAAVAATAAAKADHTAAGREAAPVLRSPAPPAPAAARSPLSKVATNNALNCGWYCAAGAVSACLCGV